MTLSNIGNENLKWETTGSTSVSLDASLFNNLWNVSVELYSSRTKDLLVNKNLSEIAGLTSYWTNGGELQNKGFNIATNVRLMNRSDFKIDLGLAIGRYKNKVVSLAENSYITDVYGAQILTQQDLRQESFTDTKRREFSVHQRMLRRPVYISKTIPVNT